MQIRIKLFLLIILFSNQANNNLFGQDIVITKNGVKEEIYLDRSEACDKDLVFMVVEQMPKYKEGIKQLEKDLNEVISFDKKIKDEFYLRCTINCEGKIFGFKERKSSKPEVAEKIKTELIKLQNWKAGKHRETSVDCFYSFKVKIKKGKIKLSD